MATDEKYEAEDGKRYSSSYSIPEGVKWKKVKVETGEVGRNTEEVYSQVIQEDEFDLKTVIEAVNQLS